MNFIKKLISSAMKTNIKFSLKHSIILTIKIQMTSS